MGQQIVTGNKLTLINFYREQLQKFNKLGIGTETETKTLHPNSKNKAHL